MPQLEAGFPPDTSTMIDLRCVDLNRRTRMWDRAVRETWPGLDVILATDMPASGSIKMAKLGTGELYEVESVPAQVDFRPVRSKSARSAFISIMVQVEGVSKITQAGRLATVQKGDICLLDETKVFSLLAEKWGRIYFLRLPRAQVLCRYPQLERLFACTLPFSDKGIGLLADLLLRLGRDVPFLDEGQRHAALGGVVEMLGLTQPPAGNCSKSDWRIRRALDYIEFNLSVPGLSAQQVAGDQRISRRRLDEIMQQQIGESISAHIWSRKLERAAQDLRNPQYASRSIAQIAFANGFEDAAHFTRAFKRRYLETPGVWRKPC